jgi:hypothetical protein
VSRLLTLVLSTLLVSGACYGHQDRIVDINSDGTLSAIPPSFGSARLRVAFAQTKNGEPPVSSVELTLGAQRVSLPVCVTGLLHTDRIQDVHASASWYHDEKLLPYYLSLKFFDPGYDQRASFNPGYALLFNLRTARLMQMEVHVVHNKGQTMQSVPVDLEARCSPQELERFRDAWRPRA